MVSTKWSTNTFWKKSKTKLFHYFRCYSKLIVAFPTLTMVTLLSHPKKVMIASIFHSIKTSFSFIGFTFPDRRSTRDAIASFAGLGLRKFICRACNQVNVKVQHKHHKWMHCIAEGHPSEFIPEWKKITIIHWSLVAYLRHQQNHHQMASSRSFPSITLFLGQ